MMLDCIQQALQAQPRLTRRQLDVLVYTAKGMPAKQIAKTLGIGEQTVRHTAWRLYKKLGVKNSLQAAIYAARAGYV
jgi:DNA-binding NarL/FixJ family response regulator